MKMTVKEVADRMGVSQDFVRESIAQGKIKGAYLIQRRKGRRTFFIDRELFEKEHAQEGENMNILKRQFKDANSILWFLVAFIGFNIPTAMVIAWLFGFQEVLNDTLRT